MIQHIRGFPLHLFIELKKIKKTRRKLTDNAASHRGMI